MATITKRGNGQWQAKISRKGYPQTSKTFTTKQRAESWVRELETEMDKGTYVSRKAHMSHARKPKVRPCMKPWIAI